MRLSKWIVATIFAAGCGTTGGGDAQISEQELAKYAVQSWDFVQGNDQGLVSEAGTHHNSMDYARAFVGAVVGEDGKGRLDAVVFNNDGTSRFIKDASAEHGIPLRVIQKVKGDSTDFRVITTGLNTMAFHAVIKDGELHEPETVAYQAVSVEETDSKSTPFDATVWTFGTMEGLFSQHGLKFSPPENQSAYSAVSGLLGTAVCPDASISETDFDAWKFTNKTGKKGSHVVTYAAEDRLDQPMLEKSGHLTINLTYFYNQIMDLASEQSYTDEQRAAVVCALQFFAVHQLSITHNWKEFIRRVSDKDAYMEALTAATDTFRTGYGFAKGTPEILSVEDCDPGSGSGGGAIGNEIQGMPSESEYPTPSVEPDAGTNAGAGAGEAPCSPGPVVAYHSPLVIATNDAGVSLSNLDAGVNFDLLGQGVDVKTGWVTSGSLLAADLNANGKIDSGLELFGQATRTMSGRLASDGFAALAEHDNVLNGGNGNGEIDAGDAVYAVLTLWNDANHDGQTQAGELTAIADAGIAAIGLVAGPSAMSAASAAGNDVPLQGNVLFTDGTERPVYDVWFAYENIHTGRMVAGL